MDEELKALEDKIQQFLQLCQRLRTENGQLRQQLAVALNENKQMAEKVNGAKSRLETLLKRIPDSEK